MFVSFIGITNIPQDRTKRRLGVNVELILFDNVSFSLMEIHLLKL
jgi:hypothetical protein